MGILFIFFLSLINYNQRKLEMNISTDKKVFVNGKMVGIIHHNATPENWKAKHESLPNGIKITYEQLYKIMLAEGSRSTFEISSEDWIELASDKSTLLEIVF
jgi:hypothetical protein